MAPLSSATGEHELTVDSGTGDAEAFERLVVPHRASVHAHCYRMLGSLHDADDAFQETLLRAWRALGTYEGRSSAATWLYRIATNVCLDAIRRRPKRVLPVDYGPRLDSGAEVGMRRIERPIWIEPYPDRELADDDLHRGPEALYEQREAIELAFIAALQHLPARQRAVLILRDVLGFTAKHVAAIMETTPASIHSLLQRARDTLDRRAPRRSQQATLRALGDEHVRSLVERFLAAFDRGDVGSILAVLAEDATFSRPPYEGWCMGRAAIAESWLIPSGPPSHLRYVPAEAGGQIALGVYRSDPEAGAYLPVCLDVVAVRDEQIGDVIAFDRIEDFSRFGLPGRLPLGMGQSPRRVRAGRGSAASRSRKRATPR